jgi:Kef-type K+ transport system membrane component KefB
LRSFFSRLAGLLLRLDGSGKYPHHPPRDDVAMLNNIEIIICLLLLFMGVPDLCRKLGRPALGYPTFVVMGLCLAPLVNVPVQTMLQQAGEVGFVLLLFEVGLEIELPHPRELVRPLRFVLLWALCQYPLLFLVARVTGISLAESLVAAAALTSCSVGMAHAAWKHYALPDAATRTYVLYLMILLELLAVVLLSVETVVVEAGWSWRVPFHLAGIVVVVLLIAGFTVHVNRLFQTVLEKTTHWRVHFLVLLVLVICAAGERLFGLAAPKTGFLLGLFMSRIQHDGKGAEEYMAPVSRRFLIPLFFVALGMQLSWRLLFTPTAALALGTAGLLLGFREVLHRRWLKTGGDRFTFLLLTPNFTIVALAADSLLRHGGGGLVAPWLLMSGLFMTVLSLLCLPRIVSEISPPPGSTAATPDQP